MEFPNFHAQKTRGTFHEPPGTAWFLLSTLISCFNMASSKEEKCWETLVLLVSPHLLVISRDFWSCFPLYSLSMCLHPFLSLHLRIPSLGLWIPFLRYLRRPRHPSPGWSSRKRQDDCQSFAYKCILYLIHSLIFFLQVGSFYSVEDKGCLEAFVSREPAGESHLSRMIHTYSKGLELCLELCAWVCHPGLSRALRRNGRHEAADERYM